MSDPVTSSHRRKWIVRTGITLATMVILYAGAAYGLSRFLDPEELASWVEPRLERALSRDVAVARVEVVLFPLGVGLREVTLSDPTGLAPFLARVASVDLRVKLLPLLRREVQVHRLTVDGLEADFRISSDGRSNFGDLSTRKADQPEEVGAGTLAGTEVLERPFTLSLKSIRFNKGAIKFSRDSDTLAVGVGNLGLKANIRREADGSWLLVGSSESELDLQRGEASPRLEKVPVGLSFDVQTDGDLNSLRIRTGEMRMDQLSLHVTGDVDGVQDPVRSVSLALSGQDLSVPDLLAILPDSDRNGLPVEADGVLAINLRIDGELGPGQLPEVTGDLGLTRGRLALEGKPLTEGLSAELSLLEGLSVQTHAQASVLDGPLAIDGVIALRGVREVDLTFSAAPHLEELGTLLELPEGVATQGRIDIHARVTGPSMDLDGLRFNGELRPVQVRISHPSLAVPIDLPAGLVRLSGNRGIIQELPVSLGDDHLSISGEIADLLAILDREARPRFEGSVQGPRLDLRRISAKTPPDSTLTYGKIAFAKIGGWPVGGRGFKEAAEELGLARPDSLPFTGSLDVRLDTVIDRQGRMEDLRARVDFGPTFLGVSDVVFHRFGGEVRTAANLTLGPETAAPFSLNLEVLDVDAGTFLSQTSPLGRFVTGRINLQLDLVGSLDALLLPDGPALVGSGSFSLAGGLTAVPLTQALADFLGLESLRAPSVQEWETSFLLEEGRVRLADATIYGAPGTPRVGGVIGLDGGLELQSAFDLPSEHLNTSTLARLGVEGERAASLLSQPEMVQAVLRIGGSVLHPTIQADPQATAVTVGAAVEEEVRSEIQERIEEQKQVLQDRATGFLRNLVERRDTTPPDTLRPDTILPDTIPGDTLRPDTILPDTTLPDTTPPDTLRPDTVQPGLIHLGGLSWARVAPPDQIPLQRLLRQNHYPRPGPPPGPSGLN